MVGGKRGGGGGVTALQLCPFVFFLTASNPSIANITKLKKKKQF